jgi:ABC-type antimicrobial peptide transport system permease subunit
VATLQGQWEALYPDAFFQYEWVDEHVAMLYTLEDMFYRLFRLMAGLALLVGGLGLYGLASYLTLHRRKEIGIRKTLGATVSDILFRFTREFTGLVVLAFVVAAPLGYLAMHAWLGTFAHRIELHSGFFGATLLIALTLAALTVGYRSLLAAGANPVDSLRDE